eukprot:COSAG02_NODE_7081_length_3194_cov_2.330210_2_plen_103_part_00
MPGCDARCFYNVAVGAKVASEAEIKAAYKRKALIVHPDKHSDSDEATGEVLAVRPCSVAVKAAAPQQLRWARCRPHRRHRRLCHHRKQQQQERRQQEQVCRC